MNPDLATAGAASRATPRSLELRGASSIITITVQPAASGGAAARKGFLYQMLAAVGRLLNRVASPGRVQAMDLADLPPELVVLSYYYQALQGLPDDLALADALGLAPAEVEDWKGGQVPSEEKLRRLRDLATVIARLAEYYDPRAIPDWLYGRNPDLGGRKPVKLLREGNLADVLSAAEAQINGAYI